jgi:transposase
MSRRKKEPLRTLTDEARAWLEGISRSQTARASPVARAKPMLNVANGDSYQEAAFLAGRTAGDAISNLVKRSNREGVNAIPPRHGGGPAAKYGPAERERIWPEVRRQPAPDTDGTATWSLNTLCQALRKAPEGWPEVSEETIRAVLLEADCSWQAVRSWCETGQVTRKRTQGKVTVTNPDAMAQKTCSHERIALAKSWDDPCGPRMKPGLIRPGLLQEPVGNRWAIQPFSRTHIFARERPSC